MDKYDFRRNLEFANKERDRRSRKSLLATIYELRVTRSGWCSGVTLSDVLNADQHVDEHLQNDDYYIGLLRDLVIKGFVEERQKTVRRGEKFGLRHLEYRILTKGLDLHLEYSQPDPSIDDGRITRC